MSHPNAVTAGAAGAGPGLAVVWALGYFGIDIGAEAGAVIATAAATAAVFIGRRGLRGLLALIWRGEPAP